MPKRRHGEHEHDGRRAAANKKHRRRGQGQGQGQGRRLYLVFDDWPWGYSIREINLQHPRDKPALSVGTIRSIRPRCLPRPFIQIEVPRGYANFFAAVGTKILVTHCRNSWDADSVPRGFLPIIDVRSRGVNFGPGQVSHHLPIFLPVGDDDDVLVSVDTLAVRVLSLKLLWPPRQEDRCSGQVSWSWRRFSRPPFVRAYVTSYAVHPGEHAILVSTGAGTLPDEEEATFALHTDRLLDMVEEEEEDDDDELDMVEGEGEELVWTRLGGWPLPFAGREHFVHCLDAFVGLSKDPATLGHLCSCSCSFSSNSKDPPAWKLGKEKLFSDDPAETHVGATLVHMGGSEFCLVQCVSIGGDDGASSATDPDPDKLEELQHKDTNKEDPDKLIEELQHEQGGSTTADHEQQLQEDGCRSSYLYRLTTFSVCYDDSGDLTTGGTCRTQCYKVPEEITKDYFLLSDPVAFWL